MQNRQPCGNRQLIKLYPNKKLEKYRGLGDFLKVKIQCKVMSGEQEEEMLPELAPWSTV